MSFVWWERCFGVMHNSLESGYLRSCVTPILETLDAFFRNVVIEGPLSLISLYSHYNVKKFLPFYDIK